MTPWLSDAVVLAILLLGVAVIPWLGIRMLVPELESATAAAAVNYRGRRVVYGLGLVWVMWVVGAALAESLLELIADKLWFAWLYGASSAALRGLVPQALVLVAFALGAADDFYGTGAERGFRGHLAALRRGRLTTGGLKLFGIGLLAAVVTFPSDALASGRGALPFVIGRWALATLAIALSANFVNLTDLRPGRALKAYSAIAVILVLVPTVAYGFTGGPPVLVLLLGPVVAVWRYDLGERAMLGDAGANAAGALIGWVALQMLAQWWMLAIYVALLLAANIVSERISFTRVIEGNRFLNWLDSIGRSADEGPPQENVAQSRHPVATTEK